MKRIMALVALSMILIGVGVQADGIIIPEPMPPFPHPELLEVKYHLVDVTIDNQVTETKIDQVFHNPNNWDIEGTYLFPLPQTASIQKFSMYVDDDELTGEILDADEARKVYEDLVRKLIDPGLLEYVDRNTFKARVHPIEANSDKRVKLDYSEVIPCENGICEYTYPLNTEKFSSKKLDEVAITVKVNSNVPIKNIYSPTHEIEVKRISDTEAEVSYEGNNIKPDTDFKLIYTISEDDIGVNLLTHKEGDTGYFLLMLAPKFAVDQSTVIEKDIVFVLDKSGSMAGDKIDQAKDALKFILNNLNEGDKFGIVTFSTGVTTYKDSMESVTSSSVDDALDFVDEIKAVGGTDIHDALLEALDLTSSDDRPKFIIFLTDGEPTVGVTNINTIIEDTTNENDNTKIFVFGVGYDVNTNLLDKLSLENHGVSEYVLEDESIEVKVSNFYEKVDNPVLSDITIDISGINDKEMYPRELPDIFKGSQILVFGQYTGDGQADIEISGEISGIDNILRYRRNFPDYQSSNDFLPRLWATRKIGFLLEEIRLMGEDDELIEEVIELSKKYGIATPYTSFLILEDEPTGDGWNLAREALAPSVGFDAVTASGDISSYKGAQSAGGAQQTISGPGGEQTAIKYVGGKTFIEKDGFLTDTDYDGQTTLNLKYGSDNYFDVLADNPGLGKYFAVDKNVIVCAGGVCILVDENLEVAESDIGKLDLGEIPSPPKLPDAVCGNGVCELGEDSSNCAKDCAIIPGPGINPNPGGIMPEPKGDDFTLIILIILIVAVLILLIVVLAMKRGKKK